MTEPKRDHYGRYKLPHPDTGAEVVWTRATTFADALEDSYGLTQWKMRASVKGVTMRPDLVTLAQSLDIDEDKKQFDDLTKSALTVAQADRRSNLGTALHKMTEHLDRGKPFRVPDAHKADIDAYQRLKADAGVATNPRFVERITVLPEWKVAGTFDRIIRRGGKLYIGDLKTGDNLYHSWKKIAIQLALYAHGHSLWNAENGTYEAMPPVDQEKGYVLHVPAGQGEASLYEVDIAEGWEAAQLCAHVRDWRRRKDLAVIVETGK